MTVTLSCLYDDYGTAKQVVRDLEAAGIPSKDISIVAKDRRVDRDADGRDDRAEGAEIGAGLGAVLGGTAGLLAGLGMLAIPGIGPVVAGGWLAATAAGAVAGGATGGIIGALMQLGLSREHAHVYAESIRRGSTLVTARVPDADAASCKAIMNRSAVDVEERATALRRSGWREFDENAPAYVPDRATPAERVMETDTAARAQHAARAERAKAELLAQQERATHAEYEAQAERAARAERAAQAERVTRSDGGQTERTVQSDRSVRVEDRIGEDRMGEDLASENARLRQLVADLSLENQTLKASNRRS